MGYEIDFHQVGEESKSGDAITIRYGNLAGKREEQKIILIDGGFKETAEKLENHIRNICKTDYIDLIILSHPDGDHVSGLIELIDNIDINEIWMHRPWIHAKDIKDYLKDNRWTLEGLEKSIKEQYAQAFEFEQKILKLKKMPKEPFSGLYFDDRIITILSPKDDEYLGYLLNFESTPEPKEDYKLPKKKKSVFKEAIKWIKESWNEEKLLDPEFGDTSYENESSTLLLFNYDNFKFLFTSDIGITGFTLGFEYANKMNISLNNLNGFQIPHHGSKHNIGPTVLNRLIGNPLKNSSTENKGSAIASVAKKSDVKHPSRKVTNAILRRGFNTYSTQEMGLFYNKNSLRTGNAATKIQFYSEVDDD